MANHWCVSQKCWPGRHIFAFFFRQKPDANCQNKQYNHPALMVLSPYLLLVNISWYRPARQLTLTLRLPLIKVHISANGTCEVVMLNVVNVDGVVVLLGGSGDTYTLFYAHTPCTCPCNPWTCKGCETSHWMYSGARPCDYVHFGCKALTRVQAKQGFIPGCKGCYGGARGAR